jgi:hypothetical protein
MEALAASKAAQPQLLQKAAEAQKQLDAQHAAYEAERSELDRMVQKSNAVQGGASQWFGSKNAVAQMGMILGQAFGAYAATLGGGQNWAQQQINTLMDHDIAAQKEAASRGVDNAYRMLQLRYKDNDQAEAALRLAQGNVLSNVQGMHAAANQAQDVQAAHQEMTAENQQAMVANEQKFQNAAYGKHKVTVDLTHQAASGGGQVDRLELMKKFIAAGFSKEEAKRMAYGEGGGGANGDAIDRKNVATVGGQPYEFDSDAEAKTAKERVPKLDSFIAEAKKLRGLLNKPGGLTNAERGEASQIQRQMGLEFGPAFTGSTRVNMDEVGQGWKAVGDPEDILKTDAFGHKTAAIDALITHAQTERDGVMGGGMRVSRQTGVNEQGQRERKYKYQTAPATLEQVE